jgi:hypothetical protein
MHIGHWWEKLEGKSSLGRPKHKSYALFFMDFVG